MPPKREITEYEQELSKLLSEKVLDNGKKYGASSIKIFTGNIYKLFHKVHADGEIKNLTWLLNYQEVIKSINDLKLNTKISYLNAVIVALSTTNINQEIKEHYATIRDHLQNERDKEQPKGTNPSQQQTIMDKITKQDIYDMINTLIKEAEQKVKGDKDPFIKRRKAYMTALIFKIHTLYPFRNDLAGSKIITKEYFDEIKKTDDFKKNNWIVIQPKTISFIKMKYKTSTKYGMTIIKFTDKSLTDMIRTWVDTFLKVKPDDLLYNKTPLISYNTGTPLTSNDLSHLLRETSKKLLGHPISTTIMAKIFTLAPDDIEHSTIEQLKPAKEQAKARGHSLKTKLGTYSK